MSKDMSEEVSIEMCQIRLSKHMSEEKSDKNVRRYVRKNAYITYSKYAAKYSDDIVAIQLVYKKAVRCKFQVLVR